MKLQITMEMLTHDYKELSQEMEKNPSNEIDFLLASYAIASSMLKLIHTEYDSLNLTLYDIFKHYEGKGEDSVIYETIQRWYYGSFVKDAWCATAMSWALYQLGILKETIHKKCENVYLMTKELWTAVLEGSVTEISDKDIIKGDIVIFSWDGNFGITSKKHCAVACGTPHNGYITVIGGNQDDSICQKGYSIDSIVTAFRPDYTKVTLKSLEGLPNG